MNISVEGWPVFIFLVAYVLAPPLYLALAWWPAHRGSVRGVWLVALAMTAVMWILVAWFVGFGPALVIAIMMLVGPVFIVCAALLHAAIRRRKPEDHWLGWIAGTLAMGYLTLLAVLTVAVRAWAVS